MFNKRLVYASLICIIAISSCISCGKNTSNNTKVVTHVVNGNVYDQDGNLVGKQFASATTVQADAEPVMTQEIVPYAEYSGSYAELIDTKVLSRIDKQELLQMTIEDREKILVSTLQSIVANEMPGIQSGILEANGIDDHGYVVFFTCTDNSVGSFSLITEDLIAAIEESGETANTAITTTTLKVVSAEDEPPVNGEQEVYTVTTKKPGGLGDLVDNPKN